MKNKNEISEITFPFVKSDVVSKLCMAMIQDKYDDTDQDTKEDRYRILRPFVIRNLTGLYDYGDKTKHGNKRLTTFYFNGKKWAEAIRDSKILDIGCGTGGSFKWYPITHALEPSTVRFRKALALAKESSVEVKQGFCEVLPYSDKFFDAVMALGVWEHLRSDFESLVEINRVLDLSGMFIFTLVSRSPAGRVFEPMMYQRTVEDFGFDLVEKRYIHVKSDWGFYCFAFRKIREFDPKWLNKLQITNLKHVKNYHPLRDYLLR